MYLYSFLARCTIYSASSRIILLKKDICQYNMREKQLKVIIDEFRYGILILHNEKEINARGAADVSFEDVQPAGVLKR